MRISEVLVALLASISTVKSEEVPKNYSKFLLVEDNSCNVVTYTILVSFFTYFKVRFVGSNGRN